MLFKKIISITKGMETFNFVIHFKFCCIRLKIQTNTIVFVSPPFTTATGPLLLPFTLNFTITNLQYEEDMHRPGSRKFNTTERVLQGLVRPLSTSLCPSHLTWSQQHHPCQGHGRKSHPSPLETQALPTGASCTRHTCAPPLCPQPS